MPKTIRIGPARPGDPVLGLLVAPFGAGLLWLAFKAAGLRHPDDGLWAPLLAAAGLAVLAGAAWLARKGVTGRAALEIGPDGLTVQQLRPARAVRRIGWGELVALHHGGLGDKHPLIRLEYRLPPAPDAPGHVPMPRRTAMLALPRHGLEVADPALLALLRQGAEEAGLHLEEKAGIPVLGRVSWVVRHSDRTST